jgi:glycine/D-amino acid oxidase-like deaminating enzyme
MRRLLREFVPDLDGRWRSSEVCMYTNTPDGDFILDWHPRHPQVLVVSPCSGHGFKFASALGEVVADLVLTRRCRFDLTPFQVARFAGPPSV